MKEIKLETSKKDDVIDITKEVENSIDIEEGIVLIYTPHTTCSIIINENHDPNVNIDILNSLKQLIPEGKWLHDKIDNNAAAHIKSTILGCSKLIPIKNKKLQLGTWQSLSFIDFDGPKTRKIIISTIKKWIK